MKDESRKLTELGQTTRRSWHHDLQIVATMLANGTHRIYTYNNGDFEAFPELSVIKPQLP